MLTAADIYARLLIAYGRPRWWSHDPFIVMVQAILVQNTAWAAVEKVTSAMAEYLTPEAIARLDAEELERLIRPCGFCRGKAAAIRRLTAWYGAYECDAQVVRGLEQSALRKELLGLKGIGAETADVILVYAFHKPSFVIDAYTRRLLERLGLRFAGEEALRAFFEGGLTRDYQLYGWFHWLILEHGIRHCKKTPACAGCALGDVCAAGGGERFAE